MAEEAAILHSEANIRTDVEAIRKREGQLPKIVLGDGRGDTIRVHERRQSTWPQPRAHSSLFLEEQIADLNTTKVNN